jgi:hypothetical protein
MAYKIQLNGYAQSWIRSIRSVPERIQGYFSHLYVKWLVKTGRVLERTRSYNGVLKMLEKNAVKDLFYGGIMEILKNRDYYYNSGIGSDYSHFTDRGKETMEHYLKSMSQLMLKAEEESLNKRAKELVIKGLKGETV